MTKFLSFPIISIINSFCCLSAYRTENTVCHDYKDQSRRDITNCVDKFS
jgi:hypothetical protein